MAAMTRPQFGSPPKKAVLHRNDSAMVRQAFLASSLVEAPFTSTSTRRVAPSPSLTIICASSTDKEVRRAVNSLKSLVPAFISEAPLMPLAKARTVSLVEVSLSTIMLLKEALTALFRASARRGALMSASVMKKASMVAMFGQIMPAPLQRPAMTTSRPPILALLSPDF